MGHQEGKEMTEEARTIRQAIKDSLDKTEDEVIIVDGKEQTCHGMLPLPFRYVITNMAATDARAATINTR